VGAVIDMRLWQRSMIALARSDSITRFMQARAGLSTLARQFVAGPDTEELLATVQMLRSQGCTSSIFYLGEYVEQPEVIDETISRLIVASRALASSGVDVHISVDPTQIGLMIDEATCRTNARRLAEEIAFATAARSGSHRDYLVLDMEDSSVTQFTVDLYRELRTASLPTAVTIQAYLNRTESDLRDLVGSGGAIRLVKGAFAERKQVAATRRSEIDRRFLRCADLMLSDVARESGLYPVFATHDEELIEKTVAMADLRDWPKSDYEFEMLLGVRTELHETLTSREEQLRLYVPFGEDWWPYAARRVGESPRNLGFLIRSLLASSFRGRRRGRPHS
jgi:proline dehydrogenase